MHQRSFSAFAMVVIVLAVSSSAWSAAPEPLALGAEAPPFQLEGVDGKQYGLEDFEDAAVLAMIFTCNHCPTAQAYEDRIQQLHEKYSDRGVAVVAVSPNDPAALRLDELGYTDVSDSLEDMEIRAEHRGFTFPYLYDGDVQEMSKAYGALATPHVFVFDSERKLRYEGRFDDRDNPAEVTSHDTVDAIESLLAGEPVKVAQTNVRGCSVKWSDKRPSVAEAQEKWEAQPVTVADIDLEEARKLVANGGDKLRLINVWATWCGPCVVEFPDLVEIQRMYGHRDFELVTVSIDEADNRAAVEKFLNEQHAAMTNYHYTGDDPNALVEAIGSGWRGNIPFTVLVAPGGEVLFSHSGIIDPLTVKRAIADHLGRTYY
jgi:thiol-disulfide isomerase/thioredoxin